MNNPSDDCCQTKDVSVVRGNAHDRTGAFAASGSVLAAILSSACCWLPLVLIGFGASAAGVAGFFESFRLYFIIGAVGLLSIGFYTVYLRKEKCEPGSACATPHPKLRNFNQAMLWTATVLVAVFVFFPSYVGAVIGSPPPASVDAGDPRVTAEFRVEGMTCEGCADILRSELAKVPNVAGVDVSYAKKMAIVRYKAEELMSIKQVTQAIEAAGYEATRIP